MNFVSIQKKSEKELQTILAEKREQLRVARFKVAQRALKNVREIREIRKDIAQLLTAIKK